MYYQTDISKTPKEMLVELLNHDNGTDFTVDTLHVHADLNRVDALSEVTIETLRESDEVDIPTTKVNFRHVPLDGLFSEITIELREVDIINEARDIVTELVIAEFARKYGINTSIEWFETTGDFSNLTFSAKSDNYVYAGTIPVRVISSLHRRVANVELGGFSLIEEEYLPGYDDRSWAIASKPEVQVTSPTLYKLPAYDLQIIAPAPAADREVAKMFNRTNVGVGDFYRSANRETATSKIRMIFNTPMMLTGLRIQGGSALTGECNSYTIVVTDVAGKVQELVLGCYSAVTNTAMFNPAEVREITLIPINAGYMSLSRLEPIKALGPVDLSVEHYEDFTDLKMSVPRPVTYSLEERNKIDISSHGVVITAPAAYGSVAYPLSGILNRTVAGITDGYLSAVPQPPTGYMAWSFHEDTEIQGFVIEGLRFDGFGMKTAVVRLVNEANAIVYEKTVKLTDGLQHVILETPIAAKSLRVYPEVTSNIAIGRLDVLLPSHPKSEPVIGS